MEEKTIFPEIIKRERLPENTNVLQTDDGTIYYWYCYLPHRIYTKLDGKVINVPELPGECLVGVGAHGNFIYFAETKTQKVYKTAFSPTKGFRVWIVRDMVDWVERKNYEEAEKFEQYKSGYCRRMKNGKSYAYAIWDETDSGIVLKDTEESLNKLNIEFFGYQHRGKAIYHIKAFVSDPLAKPSHDANAINLIEPRNHTFALARVLAKDSSALMYITFFTQKVYVLDTNTMRFLPSLEFSVWDDLFSGCGEIACPVGVFNGMITVHTAKEKCPSYLLTIRLPEGYYDKTEVHAKQEEGNTEEQIDQMTADAFQSDLVSDNNLLDQCCCPICSENFDSVKIIPLNLDCGHTFCQDCIFNRLRINNKITCPNCATATSLPEGKQLPKNFALISISDQLTKSRVDPKFACKSCETKILSSSTRVCISEDCEMFNQFLCSDCALDGGHGGHVIKYEVMLEKIRSELRESVDTICSQVKEKKKSVRDKKDQLTQLFETIESSLLDAEIPSQVLSQIDNIGSQQDAAEYIEIVKDLAKTITDQCDALCETFDTAITSANGLALLGGLKDTEVDKEQQEKVNTIQVAESVTHPNNAKKKKKKNKKIEQHLS